MNFGNVFLVKIKSSISYNEYIKGLSNGTYTVRYGRF